MRQPWPGLNHARVLITGASSGLGYCTAARLAPLTHSVVITARRKAPLERLRKAILSAGGSPFVVMANLRKVAEISRLRAAVDRRLGGIDILINCAAGFSVGPTLIELEPSDWADTIDTNLRAPYLLAQAFAPGMVDRGYGKIVNLISATNHVEQFGCFRVSKIGLEVLTSVLAAELGESGVTTFALNPGWFRSKHVVSGPSPDPAARAIIELIQRPHSGTNGRFFDLRFRNSRRELVVRSRAAGRYGFRSFPEGMPGIELL